MKVGDYVRYKYENYIYIGKIKFISEVMSGLDETLQLDIDNCMEEILKEDVIKSSPNIIDLIEVGDIVNDEKIIDIGCLTNGPEEETKVIDYYIAPNTVYYLKNEDIKSIVTKEQFENCMYKIGE